jgi:hypothetical protein
MKTNLKVEIVLITPDRARNYLKFNTENRLPSKTNLSTLVNEMKDGRFLENGEAIIFDKLGNLKDGQHRLMAIVRSGKSYYIPVVKGVDPQAMATYDTGKKRSASDVLQLNNFKNPLPVAAFIVSIDKFHYRNSKSSISKGNTGKSSNTMTNQQVLDFCGDNYFWIDPLISKVRRIYERSSFKVLTHGQLALLAFMIGGEDPDNKVYDFLTYLCGISKQEGTASNYIFTKLYNSKINKEPLNFYWVLGMSIRAYNFFIEGNPAVRRFQFNVEHDLPVVLKY